ncbi:MAG: hypothetical protein HYU78_08255 [Rhodocyclales bacterium]|nr:hypothetical protein [Rhodocyclales bacterium]
MQQLLGGYLWILQSDDALLLGLIIFSSGVGIGAAVIQINSIVSRQANDAVTSVITWMLLLAFSLSAIYYLWHSSANVIIPLLIGTLALSSAAGLAVSLNARKRLAEVAAARRQPNDETLLQDYQVLRTASALRKRLRLARQQR